MVRIFSLLSTIIFFFGGYAYVSAVEAEPSLSEANIELSVQTVRVIDSATVQVVFSDDIDRTSIVLKITKQTDNSSVEIADVKDIIDSPDSVNVILKDNLEEGTSYTLTVLAAIGTSGSTIIDGAGALREFVTPSPLKQAIEVLNAPANPNAVIVSTGTTNEAETPIIEEDTPVPTEELPLAGINSLWFLLFALPLAYFFLRQKSV